MAEKWGNDVGRTLLFDRLVDEDPYTPSEKTPARALTHQELYDSIHKELTRLLATRCPVSGDIALSRKRSILDYGLPDLEWGGRFTEKQNSLRLEKLIRMTIEGFEPRLRGVEVELVKTTTESGIAARLQVHIEATLVLENVQRPLSFSPPIGTPEGG